MWRGILPWPLCSNQLNASKRRNIGLRAKDWIWSGKAEKGSEFSSVVVWRGFSSLYLRSPEIGDFLKTCLPIKSCWDLRRSDNFYWLCKVIGTSVRWPIHREKAVVWYLDEKSSGSTAEKWIFECLVVSTSISSSDLFILSVSRRKDEDPWFFLLNILLKYRSDN